jgi:DNA-binding PucR family transcriptional regulator/GAF domain-containing protein
MIEGDHMLSSRKKRRSLIDKIDVHLRKVARQLLQFDTLDKTFHYLIESFLEQFPCDYVSIVLISNDQLIIKTKEGNTHCFDQSFPMKLETCLPRILTEPLCSFDIIEDKENCSFLTKLEAENFQTWFTLPIRQSHECLGLCVIGFRSFVPLVLEGNKLFEEFGKDIAAAISIVQLKESELKKVQGLEWMKESVYLGGSSLEQIVENIVDHAGKGTDAKCAYVYLYDENNDCFMYQPPSYGECEPPTKIELKDNYDLNQLFAYLERPGGNEITVPLIVNLKTIGVLHVVNKNRGQFTTEDLELLQLLSSHVSALIENSRLYKNEMDRKDRLETFMKHQQELVKYTLEDEGFSQISKFLANMLNCSVVLFDRFMHPISNCLMERDQSLMDVILHEVESEKKNLFQSKQMEQWLKVNGQFDFGIWKVVGGGDLLGYLGLLINKKDLDMVLKMTLNHALNVYAVQFIKQKLVIDVKEQVKDSFFNQLFVEKLQNREKIVEYANLLKWNLYEPHCVGIFSFEFENNAQNADLLELEARKTWIWERIRDHVARSEQGIFLTRKDGYYIVIIPYENDKDNSEIWKTFYTRIKKLVTAEMQDANIYLGISQKAEKIEDYYICYRQALQTLTILINRFQSEGFLTFDNLGSYTVLYNLGDPFAAQLFLRKYLEPLLKYGNGKNKDLFDTLRVYLNMNGNIKDTADHLFIHRSSLKYRLEKIKEILVVDIEDAEQRFNLMLAYKLYDLYNMQHSITVS